MRSLSNGRFSTCFISAPTEVDTKPLRAALERKGIGWLDSASATPVGFSVLDTIDAAISRADFVCGVVPADEGKAGALVEIGIAIAHGKPVILFIDPKASVPGYLESLPYARIRPGDSDALRLHLDAFLQHADAKSWRQTPIDANGVQLPDTGWAISELDALEALPPADRGIQLERIVARLLEQAGAVVSTNPQVAERGVDMAISMKALEPSLGNPLLVEVRAGRLGRARIDDAERRLRTFVEKASARAGLLVLSDNPKHERTHEGWPLVVMMGARELAIHVERGSLVQALASARNQAAHGRA